MTPITLKTLLLQYSKADSRRLFSFSSGHVGALPIPESDLARLLKPNSMESSLILIKSLLKESLILAMQMAIPVKNIGLTTRALLRKIKGKGNLPTHPLSVISLGQKSPGQDPYIGTLLSQLKEPFNYLTIVGGSCIKSSHYHFVEEALLLRHILWLYMTIPLRGPYFLCRLIKAALSSGRGRERILFLLCGLKEINSGGALTQHIIVQAVSAHLNHANAQTVLFPMEGRNWEKAIARSANILKIKSYGYLHCALTPRHLGLLDSDFIQESERPSHMIVPSEMAYGLLHKVYGSIVRKGFFLRGTGHAVKPQQTCPDLLFALIGDVVESEFILRHVADLRPKMPQRLVIRLNPNTSSYAHLKNLTLNLGLPLYDPASPALPQVCFFRSSSVAIEYLKQNVRSVYLALNEPISNNIFELDNKFEIERVCVDDIFGDNVRLVTNNPTWRDNFDGRAIASYYLDETFVAEDLPALIH